LNLFLFIFRAEFCLGCCHSHLIDTEGQAR
jgi:hypothetical protein